MWCQKYSRAALENEMRCDSGPKHKFYFFLSAVIRSNRSSCFTLTFHVYHSNVSYNLVRLMKQTHRTTLHLNGYKSVSTSRPRGGILKQSFTLKTHQMSCVHTTPGESKNATITGQLEFLGQGNIMIIVTSPVFYKKLSVHTKKARLTFSKAPFP